MPIVFFATLAFIALSTHLCHTYTLSQFTISLPLLLFAALLYILARTLHLRYLRRSADELTHGTPTTPHSRHQPGVPHWVQALTNVAFGAALAALVRLVEELVP